jgi:hypothetical protein
MQFVRAASTAALFLLFGTIVPSYAQHDQQKEKQGKPPEKQQGKQQQKQQQKQRAQQPRQQRPQQQAQRSQQARQQQQPYRTQQQATAWQQQRGWLHQGGWQGHSTWQQGRAQRWTSEHRTWGQRGGYGGYYIPQDRFSLYFGSRHWFRMHSRPSIYMGYPRFSYSGLAFMLVDPWPESWAENWYATDDVYIDYDDGYYLYNRRHPGVRLAIAVAL